MSVDRETGLVLARIAEELDAIAHTLVKIHEELDAIKVWAPAPERSAHPAGGELTHRGPLLQVLIEEGHADVLGDILRNPYKEHGEGFVE